jgi:hypothetical protein
MFEFILVFVFVSTDNEEHEFKHSGYSGRVECLSAVSKYSNQLSLFKHENVTEYEIYCERKQNDEVKI